MSSIVSVLTPNIESAEEYKCKLRRLSEIGIEAIEAVDTDDNISMEEWEVDMNAVLIYGAFKEKAFSKGRGLFMTLEEIEEEFWRWENINKIVESMLDRGILKEVHMEWPPEKKPLCPFCGKPSAYAIKEKRFLLLRKISGWSCWNELCRMCGEKYIL